MIITGGRAIALIDCDSFYASCEQLMNPSLLGKAVCVMSNNNGCIVARSKEAKNLGVRMGMPVFQAKKLYPDVYYIPGRLSLYGDISNRVMNVLKNYSPVVEIYSIDEAFLDLTGLKRVYRKSYLDIAVSIRNDIKKDIGIPVSVGISLTKVLAKLATERAKKSDGCYRIGYREISDELRKTKIIDIWGIGNNTAAFLNKSGIYTAYDFTIQDPKWIQKSLGKKGLELKHELVGESIYPVLDKIEKPQSIQKTSSFSTFTSDIKYIRSSLNYHAHRACRKLRKCELKTKLIGVMLRTKDFKVFYGNYALLKATNWEFEIYNAVDEIFYNIFVPKIIYRSSGITLSLLSEATEMQLSLFETPQKLNDKENLGALWDKLEKKYGREVFLTETYKLNDKNTDFEDCTDPY